MQRKKIVITGSQGFIGRHLCRTLEKDYHVVGFDLAQSVFHNITQKEEVFSFLAIERPHILIHLAANPDVAKSLEFPQEDLYLNTLGTLNVLEACRRYPVESFFLASSAVVYGEMTGHPFREDDPIKPTTPYGIGKFAAEQYCNLYFRRYQIPTAIFRLFNIYGPGQTRNFAIPNMIARIREAQDDLEMYGSPDDTRDFIYIEDICHAFRLALEQKAAGKTYNIASGKETRVLSVAETIARLLGKSLQFHYKNVGPDRIRVSRVCGDNAAIKRDLGWTPRILLEEGVAKMIASSPLPVA